MIQLAASKLSIWGSCEKSRESHTRKKTRVRGALVLSLAACFTCHNWRAYSKAIIQFIIHSVVYYLFLADLIPPLAGDADGDPAPPCKKTKSDNTFMERFHSRGQQLYKFIATRKCVLQKNVSFHRTGLEHHHGRRCIVLGHQHHRNR